jgi:hypothetical protein
LIVLEIRKRTLAARHRWRAPNKRPASADAPHPFSDPKRPVLLQTYPGSLRSGSDHDWYALGSKFDDGFRIAPKT